MIYPRTIFAQVSEYWFRTVQADFHMIPGHSRMLQDDSPGVIDALAGPSYEYPINYLEATHPLLFVDPF